MVNLSSGGRGRLSGVTAGLMILLFIDLSLGITGPLVGAVAAGFGFASIFLFAALAALTGLLLSVYLYRQAQNARAY